MSNIKEVILCKYGEIILKGANKGSFETILMKELRRRAKAIGKFTVRLAQSTVYIEPDSDDPWESDIDAMYEQAKKVFGFVGVTKAAVAEKNMDDICRIAAEYLPDKLSGCKTFRCEAKRSDKKFPLKSPEIAAHIGGVILSKMPHLKEPAKTTLYSRTSAPAAASRTMCSVWSLSTLRTTLAAALAHRTAIWLWSWI